MSEKIKILLIDDHVLFAELLAEKLQSLLINVSSFKPYQSIVQVPISELTSSQLLLLDINLNGESSLDSIEYIRGFAKDLKILMLSSEADFYSINKAFQLGANGFVNKTTNLFELKKAIELVLEGEPYFQNLQNSDILKQNIYVNNKMYHISDKEVVVIKLYSEGLTTQAIADKLNLSHRTVETHKKNIFKKLYVSNVVEMIVKAEKQGYITK